MAKALKDAVAVLATVTAALSLATADLNALQIVYFGVDINPAVSTCGGFQNDCWYPVGPD